MDLSVVITSYNTRAFLLACLRSVADDLRASDLTWEAIVVDDGSTDGTSEAVASSFPGVRLLRNNTPRGYARANNLGIRAAHGTAILLLNSDTVVHLGAIPAMVRSLQAHPEIGGVGPTLRNADGSIQRSCFRFPLRSLIGNSLSLFSLGVWDDYRDWDHRADRTVDAISSAALLLRRNLFDEVGSLSEDFWVYGIDIDYAMRMRAKGYGLLSLAGACITHYGGASWEGLPERKFSDHMHSHDLLFRKHYGRAGLFFFRAVLVLSSLLRLAVWGPVQAFGNAQARAKSAYFVRLLRWATGLMPTSART